MEWLAKGRIVFRRGDPRGSRHNQNKMEVFSCCSGSTESWAGQFAGRELGQTAGGSAGLGDALWAQLCL